MVVPADDERGCEVSNRGQSELLGLVMLLGFVAVVGVGTLLVAGDTVTDLEERSELEQTKQTLTEFNAQLRTEAVSQSGNRSMDFALGGERARVDPNAGNITIEITGDTSCTLLDDASLGAVRHERAGTEIAVQGGGVWEYDGTTSRMVSAPDIRYGGPDGRETLSVPIPVIQGDPQRTQRVRFAHNETVGTFPSSDCGLSDEENPLADSELTITVESKYFEGWGQFFEERVGTEVTYPGDETVEVTLDGPITSGTVEGPIVSDSAILGLSNNGKIDSYDSADGPYTAPGDDNAPVIVEGDFTPSNNVDIGGNVRAGGDASISNNIDVNGKTIIGGDSDVSNNPEFDDVYSTRGDMQTWGGTFNNDVIIGGDATQLGNAEVYGDVHVGGDVVDLQNSEIHGDVIANGSVSTARATIHGDVYENGARTPNEPLEPNVVQPDPVDDEIETKRTEFAASNDNDDASAIVARQLTGCGSTCTLESGTYHLDEISFHNDALELDTSDGPIELYVDDGIELSGSSRIDVVGEGGVEVYLNGDLSMSNQAQVTVPGDRAPLFWLNIHSDNTASFSNRASFVGIVNGPSPESGTGADIHISNQVEIFGALVGNIDGTSNQNRIHFDEALIEPHQLGQEGEKQRLAYLNVNVQTIEVE